VQGNVSRIGEDLDHLTETEQAASDAAYEMEINTIGAGLGVLRYAESGDKEALDRVEEDEREFREFHEGYMKGADTPKEREAGREVRALFDRYSDRGREIIEDTDRQTQTIADLDVAFVRIERILIEGIRGNIDFTKTNSLAKNQQATELEAKAAEVNALFEIHIQQPTPERKD